MMKPFSAFAVAMILFKILERMAWLSESREISRPIFLIVVICSLVLVSFNVVCALS